MVDAHHQVPPGILRQAQGKFEHEVIKRPLGIIIIFFFHFGNFRVVGEAIADGNTGIDVLIPGKYMPASDDQTVEFPESVVVEVFADLAFDFEADIIFVMPEFPCQSCDGNIIVILEFGIERENILDIVLGMGAAVGGQKPLGSYYVILGFVFIRQGA